MIDFVSMIRICLFCFCSFLVCVLMISLLNCKYFDQLYCVSDFFSQNGVANL